MIHVRMIGTGYSRLNVCERNRQGIRCAEKSPRIWMINTQSDTRREVFLPSPRYQKISIHFARSIVKNVRGGVGSSLSIK